MLTDKKIAVLKDTLKNNGSYIFELCSKFPNYYFTVGEVYKENKDDDGNNFIKTFEQYSRISDVLHKFNKLVVEACVYYHSLDYFYGDCFIGSELRTTQMEGKRFNDDAMIIKTSIGRATELISKIIELEQTDPENTQVQHGGYKDITETAIKIVNALTVMLTRVELMQERVSGYKYPNLSPDSLLSNDAVIDGLRHGLADKEGFIGTDTLDFIAFIDDGRHLKIEDVHIYAIPKPIS